MLSNKLLVVSEKYEHPDGWYSYHLKKKSVTLRFKDRSIFEAYKRSRQFEKLQDLVDITTNGGYVHVHAVEFAIAGIDAVPRRGHVVWLRAFNRFHLALPVERRARKSRTIAVKYNSEGAVESFIETTMRKLKPLKRHKPAAPAAQPASKSQLEMLAGRFRRSA